MGHFTLSLSLAAPWQTQPAGPSANLDLWAFSILHRTTPETLQLTIAATSFSRCGFPVLALCHPDRWSLPQHHDKGPYDSPVPFSLPNGSVPPGAAGGGEAGTHHLATCFHPLLSLFSSPPGPRKQGAFASSLFDQDTLPWVTPSSLLR